MSLVNSRLSGPPELGSTLIELKDKAVPVYTMKAYKGTRGIAPLILNHGTRWLLV